LNEKGAPMGVRTRIGIMSLVGSQMGSIEFPEEVTLCCPQCGTLAMDKGQCGVEFVQQFCPNRKKHVLSLIVDCRSCGCYGEPPAVPEP